MKAGFRAPLGGPHYYFTLLQLYLPWRIESKLQSGSFSYEEKFKHIKKCSYAVHEITAGHQSLCGTISCVTDRIRFMLVTMTGRLSKFNSISYTEDLHELRVTGTSADCQTQCPPLAKYLFQALQV